MEGELKKKKSQRANSRAADRQLQRGGEQEAERERAMHTTLGKACRA